MSVTASVQPVEEEQGTIYYKDVVAQTTRGGVTAGDVMTTPNEMDPNIYDGYSGDVATQILDTTAAGTLTYSGTVANAPIRKERVKVTIAGLGLTAVDNGEGQLIGYDLQGTIDYTTGAITVEFRNDPGAGQDIVVETAQDFEAAPDIPKIIYQMKSKSIMSRVWALKSTVGLEQSYALKRRFGLIAEDEIASDIVSAVNSEMFNTAIKMMNAKAVGNTTFSRAVPSAVAESDHRQSLLYRITEAESVLLGNAGRGTINVMVAGLDACNYLASIPGFTKIADGTDVGPHIYGSFNGITVIRVHNQLILDKDTILCVYKGTRPFDTALVWAPYMPLVVTTALPTGANPLTNQKAAAVWGGLEVLVGNFITKLTIVP